MRSGLLRRAVRVPPATWLKKNTPASAPQRRTASRVSKLEAVVCAKIWTKPQRGIRYTSRAAARRRCVPSCANTQDEVHGEKRKDADLKGLERPGIAHKDGCGRIDQQQKHARAHGCWRAPCWLRPASALARMATTGNATIVCHGFSQIASRALCLRHRCA